MSLTIKDVENLAELAKLELTEEEKEKLLKDMGGILDYVKVIEEVEVPEMDTTYEHHNAWREDALREQEDFNKKLIIEQFPDSQPARPHDGSGAGGDGIFVKVKKIL